MNRWIPVCLLPALFGAYAASAQLNCTNSPDDEMIIEYFNQMEFNEEYEIILMDNGTAWNLALSCPEPISSTLPPSTLNLVITSLDPTSPGPATGSSCQSGIIAIDKTKLKNKLYNSCSTGNTCRFDIILSNKQTKTIYCSTVYAIEMTNGNQTILPNLEPATLPICNNTINSCLISNTCSLSSEPYGELKLCESSLSCVTPPNSAFNPYNQKPAGLL